MTDASQYQRNQRNRNGWKVNQSRVNYFSLYEWDCIITNGRRATMTRVTLTHGICHRVLANDLSSYLMVSMMIICTSHTFDSHEQNKRHLSTVSVSLALFHLSLGWNKNDSYITRFSLSYRYILHAQYTELFMKSSDREREQRKKKDTRTHEKIDELDISHRRCNTSSRFETNLNLYRSEWWHLMAPMTWHGECLSFAICVFIELLHDKVESAATQSQHVHIYSSKNHTKIREERKSIQFSLLARVTWVYKIHFILCFLFLSAWLKHSTSLWSLFSMDNECTEQSYHWHTDDRVNTGFIDCYTPSVLFASSLCLFIVSLSICRRLHHCRATSILVVVVAASLEHCCPIKGPARHSLTRFHLCLSLRQGKRSMLK